MPAPPAPPPRPARARAAELVAAAALLLGTAAAWACAGCSHPVVPRVVSDFERTLFCPASRVEAWVRDDLRLHHFACMDQPRWLAARARGEIWVYQASPVWLGHQSAIDVRCGDPPPEVRDDPGRVAVWRELQARGFDHVDDQVQAIVESRGCGHRRFYACQATFCAALGDADPVAGR